MIEHFFDINKKDTSNLFSGFEISKNEKFCNEHQNKYPVINVSFKDIKDINWNDCFESFKTIISILFQKHKYLLHSENLDKNEKDVIQNIISETAKDKFYKFSLEFLSRYLNKHFQQDVIILVDEYDTPIINAFRNTSKPVKKTRTEDSTYFENVISFMQTILGSAFKGNNSLKKGLITGVMRIGKESIFSDWNNFMVYGLTSQYFSDKFGFTQTETHELLQYFGLQNNLIDIEKWYNGYTFGNIDKIYNPWSIVSYIANEKDGFKAYWVNTSDYSLIKNRITEQNAQYQIMELIENKEIEKPIFDNFVFYYAHK